MRAAPSLLRPPPTHFLCLPVQSIHSLTTNPRRFDKELVGQFAANVRSKREPEPYKGKGVR